MVTAVKNLLSQKQSVKRNKDGSIRKKPDPKPNPVKLRDQLEDQSSDNDEVERINEADIPRTSAQANEDIISEDEDIELESNNKIDTLKKKLDH